MKSVDANSTTVKVLEFRHYATKTSFFITYHTFFKTNFLELAYDLATSVTRFSSN